MNFEGMKFTTNPNFKFKEYITDISEGYGTSSLFEVFIDKEGDTILASPYMDIANPYSHQFHISLISLSHNKEKKKLIGHIHRLKVIRYFINTETKKEYLISADRKYKVIIWDINDDYSIIFNRIIKYDNYINDVLLLFIDNNEYAVTSTMSTSGYTKIINFHYEKKENNAEYNDIIDNNNSIVNIKDSFGVKVYNLSYWHNKINNYHYIIQCGESKILISEYQNKEKYAIIESGEDYKFNLSSIIYTKKDKDILLISSSFGQIIIYDLLNKIEIKRIKLGKAYLNNIVKWNDNYFLTIDASNKSILIFNTDDYKIISCIKISQIFSHERYERKVMHPLYGESLISVGNDYKVKLYVNLQYN